MPLLRRYWLHVKCKQGFTFPSHYGVTAYGLEDAIEQIEAHVNNLDYTIQGVIEDIDVSTLNALHILPNIG